MDKNCNIDKIQKQTNENTLEPLGIFIINGKPMEINVTLLENGSKAVNSIKFNGTPIKIHWNLLGILKTNGKPMEINGHSRKNK